MAAVGVCYSPNGGREKQGGERQTETERVEGESESERMGIINLRVDSEGGVFFFFFFNTFYIHEFRN